MSQKRSDDVEKQPLPWRERWYEIIFEADTPAGKLFDVLLLIAILLSVFVVMLESVSSVYQANKNLIDGTEWFFTILFTIEYVARIVSARRPFRYIFSFYGVVDILSILPTYLTLLVLFDFEVDTLTRLTVVRALRLLRVFRVFKLTHMLSEATALRQAIWASRAKVAVFITFVVIAVVIVGSAMHLIEGQNNPGFKSIPQSMYWAIVTMTTVGYGDTAPTTITGKTVASFMMILGYCFIIIPTGIVSAELSQAVRNKVTTQVCPECMAEGHDLDATHCKYCGARL
ncbi:Cyclic nucleotide-gated potassium channel [Polystyrenella longa]|uniref:Cyclic nucleotide-gated potassium channel n=1 Tax=Polystyrenella longa TaxID=2528007 RepID=A0A518CPM8_9PLAN|nr:ion transporter [Polystyrenella longa]QDU81173.1 Cyclic nucleotide-gated potassium channel [Polystyrenella longa]